KNPGFALVAIVTLAIGIGANTAIFSVVNGVILRPLPYPEPNRLVELWSTAAEEPRSNYSAADFLDLQRQNRTLAVLAGYRGEPYTVVTPTNEPLRLEGAQVTLDYFDAFGMRAERGRTFSRATDGGSSETLVVLSHAAWVQKFAADPQIIDRRV